jgi:hypothetical protein
MEPRSLPLVVLTRRSSPQVEFFQKLGIHNGHASEGCYNPRHLGFFSLRKQWKAKAWLRRVINKGESDEA